MIQFLVVVSSFRLLAGNPPVNLGSGDPSLHIIYHATNLYIIYLNEPWVPEDVRSGGYWINADQIGYSKRQIILRSAELPSDNDPSMYDNSGVVNDPMVLYPFDEDTAFTCPFGSIGWSSFNTFWPHPNQVFSTNKDCILVSEDVYALARSRYGLTTNQLFLGRIGTNIFYWETGNPRKVYYDSVEQPQAVNYFTLPTRVRDLYGVTRALLPHKDIGIWASRKHTWLWMIYQIMPTTAGYEDVVFEFALKDAKKVKGAK
jgi:hypothetical protein